VASALARSARRFDYQTRRSICRAGFLLLHELLSNHRVLTTTSYNKRSMAGMK
jgi:hypothetical protein